MERSLDVYLEECLRKHGHVCPGQVLGVRMALLGCRLAHVEDPLGKDRKKLLVWVEIDRCLTDAISVVTGTSLGRRSLKFVDYGKASATFYNVKDRIGKRVSALEESREAAMLKHPNLSKKEAQMLYYKEADEGHLFKFEEVSISIGDSDLPGSPKRRVLCTSCGEGVNDEREVYSKAGEALCRWCLEGGYYFNPVKLRFESDND